VFKWGKFNGFWRMDGGRWAVRRMRCLTEVALVQDCPCLSSDWQL
jgi:hypothetical protein